MTAPWRLGYTYFYRLFSRSSTVIAHGVWTGSLGSVWPHRLTRVPANFTRPSRTHPFTAGTQDFFRKWQYSSSKWGQLQATVMPQIEKIFILHVIILFFL